MLTHVGSAPRLVNIYPCWVHFQGTTPAVGHHSSDPTWVLPDYKKRTLSRVAQDSFLVLSTSVMGCSGLGVPNSNGIRIPGTSTNGKTTKYKSRRNIRWELTGGGRSPAPIKDFQNWYSEEKKWCLNKYL